MASTRFRMIGVALFVVALSAMEAMQWNGGPVDKANITACVRGIASIPWSFVKGDGETLLSLAWMFQAPGKEKTQIATSNDGHFYTTDKERFGFLPKAGLSVHDARPQDSGDYSMELGFLKADSSPAQLKRTVNLSVTDTPPATQDGDLHVTLGDVVRDDVTENWTVPLHCGHFVDLGHPPVGVVWTTPSGEVRNSSYEHKGSFVLSLSSSVQGGNYSCHLPPSAPAVRCLNASSKLNATTQLYVDDKDVKLALHEAQMQETKAELKKTKAQLQYVSEAVDLMFKREKSNCKDWKAVDPRSGVRAIVMSGQFMVVYCDQVTANGGWTVFQRRKDASVNFYRNWTDYRNGFGDMEGNFWLGLDKLHSLTTSQRVELRVDVRTWSGLSGPYATYGGFYLDDASHNFALHFDNYTAGNMGDALSYHRGQPFSTKDRDNDALRLNIAQRYKGAWWFNSWWIWSHLNGEYKATHSAPNADGISWSTFGFGIKYSFMFSEMKFRPM